MQRFYRLDVRQGLGHAVGVATTADGKNGADSRARRGRAVALLAIVVLAAFGVRLFVGLRAEMISRDGAKFLWYAQGLSRQPLAEMRARDQHPLYPALVLATHQVLEGLRPICGVVPADPVRSWPLAGVIVTLAGGLAVVVAVYLLANSLFDARVALMAALLAAAAAEFCQLSADVLTDMPHLAVYLLAMVAGIRGVRDRKRICLFLAGVLSGAAFLIRPEGAEVAVVMVVGAAMVARSWPLRDRAIGVLAVCIGAALVASPYMAVTGKLVPKKSIKHMLWGSKPGDESSGFFQTAPSTCSAVFTSSTRRRLQPARPLVRIASVLPMLVSARARSPRLFDVFGSLNTYIPTGQCDQTTLASVAGRELLHAWGLIAQDWVRALRVTLLLPAIVWLIRRRRPGVEMIGSRLVATALVLHVVIASALIIRFDYWTWFSLRHVMVLAALTLPFSAAGIAAVLDLLPSPRRRLAVIALAVGLVGPTLPWMLETRYADLVHLRRAGEWVRKHGESSPAVMTTRHRVAFYANGTHVWCPPETEVDRVLPEARVRKPQWLVFEEARCLKQAPDFFERIERSAIAGETLRRVHIASGHEDLNSDRAIIYRYAPPPGLPFARADGKDDGTVWNPPHAAGLNEE